MKSVLISIRPRWCELIASGRKTIEVRKTYPKLPTPFMCYIYCTMTHGYANGGKVIGEFACDLIGLHPGTCVPSSCVPMEELERYANGKLLARWHIAAVKMYDRPRELSDFGKTRPPQSWCYVDAERILPKNDRR